MRIIKKANCGGTIHRHIERLKAFEGTYALALAAGLVSGTEPEIAHKNALALVAASADPDRAVGQFSDGRIVYTARSGGTYIFSFPAYEVAGDEFEFPGHSALAEWFEEKTAKNPCLIFRRTSEKKGGEK